MNHPHLFNHKQWVLSLGLDVSRVLFFSPLKVIICRLWTSVCSYSNINLSYVIQSENKNNFYWIIWVNTYSRLLRSVCLFLTMQNGENSKLLTNYRIFNREHKFENYFTTVPPKLMKHFIHCRKGNNTLPIETCHLGRFRPSYEKTHVS